LQANPFSDEKGDEIKKEVLILVGENLKLLNKINKDPVTRDDKLEAAAEKLAREKQAEEERRIAEEERRAAEEEARLLKEQEKGEGEG
jgi:predicted transcriptional regulator